MRGEATTRGVAACSLFGSSSSRSTALGASQAGATELEEVARAPAGGGTRQSASVVQAGAGSAASSKKDVRETQNQYAVCVILPDRVLVVDKPPTHAGGTKDSFQQDKQELVPQGGQPEETAAERSARERALERDYVKAKLKWESLAKQKDWTQVKPDLSVYRYSGEDITEDPRSADKYKDQVVGELGFGEDWKARHPDLTEAGAAAAREVLCRKAGAFWVEGTPRTTVRFVQHDTVPTGPPVRLPPHNLRGEAAEWIDAKL